MNVSYWIAFLAGMASFFSPCVLSILPLYMSYLGGRSVITGEATSPAQRWLTVLHGGGFVLGFSLVFIITGAMVSLVGAWVYPWRLFLAQIGGVLIVFFGLHVLGALQIPFLNYDLRPLISSSMTRQVSSSFLLGIAFSFGWSPCVGPVLGAILTLALDSGNLSSGLGLLTAYSLGMAIPFLLASLGWQWIAPVLFRNEKVVKVVKNLSGFGMVFLGIMLFSGRYEQLSRYTVLWDFGL